MVRLLSAYLQVSYYNVTKYRLLSLIERNPIRPILIAWGHFALREEHHNLSFLIPIPSIVPPPAHIQIEGMSNLVSTQCLDKVFYVTLASPNFFALGNKKKNEFSFCISLVFRNFAVKSSIRRC